MKKQLATITAVTSLSVSFSSAAVLLSTTLDGTTTSGMTLSDITYITSVGLTGDTSITGDNNLFATNLNDTDGHYAPNRQLNAPLSGNPAFQWTVDLGFSVSGNPVQINSIEIERQNFNSGGSFNPDTPRNYPIIVSLIGSTSGTLGSVGFELDPNESNSTETFTFAGGIIVDSSETWEFNVQFNDGTNTTSGVYAGIDGFTVNGEAVPEPSSTALLGLGGLALMLRRRR